MKSDQLTELVALMRILGVRSYKTNDVSIELTDGDPANAHVQTVIPQRTAAELAQLERERVHAIMFMASSVKPALRNRK